MGKEKEIVYDWLIVGSGIAGIICAEMLTRHGLKVKIIEKNKKLASETTRDFHEWIHTGSLYTLIPDNLYTLKFLLGSIDDIFEFYSGFENMNLVKTESGLKINESEKGWFNNNFINFKYRVKGRKWTFPWLVGISRSIFLINKIKSHDWLRRRAGIVDPFKLRFKEIFTILKKLIFFKEKFINVETPDFTANSRNILNDLINSSISNGLEISTNNAFKSYSKKDGIFKIECQKEFIKSKNILFCNGANISKLLNANVKLSYAPIAIIKNVPKNQKSYVELDYFPKNCINILTKEDGYAQIGGISFSDESKCDKYIEEVIEKHKIYNPKISVLHKYNGVKAEVILKDQPRNYLFHILNIDDNVLGVIPGKFTLGFSLAPELFRKLFKKNPKKNISKLKKKNTVMSNTVWRDVQINNLK